MFISIRAFSADVALAYVSVLGAFFLVMFYEKGGVVLPEGTVKWFSDKKGYGFIEQEDGNDVFVHHSSIEMQGFRTLSEGERVAFELESSDRGSAAKNVTKV